MIRLGLLRRGRIARRHPDLLGGNHIEGASLVAVCDPQRARADASAATFGVGAHYDMDEFLAGKNTDAVTVLADQASHYNAVDFLVNQRSALVDGLEGGKSLELISALSIETSAEVALRFEPRLGRLGVVS